jgi:hypothetical protein
LEGLLPALFSVVARMVDLIGFFTLGHIFTARITGNLVLAAAAAVRGGPPRRRPQSWNARDLTEYFYSSKTRVLHATHLTIT